MGGSAGEEGADGGDPQWRDSLFNELNPGDCGSDHE